MAIQRTATGQSAAALRRGVEPMLPTPSHEPSDSPDRLYEIKWEGIRVVSLVEGGVVAMHTRGGKSVTHAFPDVAKALRNTIGGADAVVDGELVAIGDDGIPQRHAVVDRLLKGAPVGAPATVNYEIFDILLLNGKPLLDVPLYERKAILHETVRPNETVHICHFEEGEGIAMYDAAQELGLHGIVAKDRFSLYEPGKRSRHWLSTKHARTMNLVIGGYTFGGSGQPFESLLLGAFDGQRLRYAGLVGGWSAKGDPDLLYRMISNRHVAECPFTEKLQFDRFFYWCEPTLAVEVEYGERSPDGTPRFMVVNSLRPDIDARNCDVLSLAS